MIDLNARLTTVEDREIKILDVLSGDPFPLKGLIEQGPGSDKWRVAEWDENGVYRDVFFGFRRFDLKEFRFDYNIHRTYIGNVIWFYKEDDELIYGDVKMPRRYDDLQIAWYKNSGLVARCVCSKYLGIPKAHWYAWRLVAHIGGRQAHVVTHPSLRGATSIKQAELKRRERMKK